MHLLILKKIKKQNKTKQIQNKIRKREKETDDENLPRHCPIIRLPLLDYFVTNGHNTRIWGRVFFYCSISLECQESRCHPNVDMLKKAKNKNR